MQNRLKRECQSGKAAGQLQYSLKEGMKWLQGYNKEAADAVDDIAMKHLQLIERKHGSAVLACVVFFAMGHHETCYGRREHQADSICHDLPLDSHLVLVPLITASTCHVTVSACVHAYVVLKLEPAFHSHCRWLGEDAAAC